MDIILNLNWEQGHNLGALTPGTDTKLALSEPVGTTPPKDLQQGVWSIIMIMVDTTVTGDLQEELHMALDIELFI